MSGKESGDGDGDRLARMDANWRSMASMVACRAPWFSRTIA
jgi:hypothetical protein